MMSKEAIDRIAELALEGAGKTVTIDGVEYSTTKLHDPRHPGPQAEPFIVSTLGALRDYLVRNADGLQREELLLHVASPTLVRLVSPLEPEWRRREAYLEARSSDLWAEVSERPRSQEELVTALLSRCSTGHEAPELLKIVGNVVDAEGVDYRDDGVRQNVTVRTGISVLDELEVKNPWTLAPFRTFREVEQPASPFILRIQKGNHGPRFTLHECDGGAWRLQAVERVATWLRTELDANQLQGLAVIA